MFGYKPAAWLVSGVALAFGFVPHVSQADELLATGFESGTLESSPFVEFPGTGVNVSVTSSGVVSGNYSLAFAYPAKDPSQDSSSEQRFRLSPGFGELWVSFKLRVPDDYFHRNVDGSDNNKFFKVSTNYKVSSQEGVNILWEYWPDGNGGSVLAYHWTIPGVSTSPHYERAYVFGPTESGEVQEFVLRVKMASSPSAKDGVVQTWQKRGNESTYRLIHDNQSAPFYPSAEWSGQTEFVAGYIFGWTNSSFGQPTTFRLDDLKFSTNPLLGVPPEIPKEVVVE